MNEPDLVSSESLIHLADVNANSSANKDQNKLTLVRLEMWEMGGEGVLVQLNPSAVWSAQMLSRTDPTLSVGVPIRSGRGCV